ncbi:MAG: TPM domain-containing protein [Zoogloeaceae bacterium]|uniref:TPM domain-containing protein n=1 Tax=Denitromonas sp. TaxID=2734609 RepID=UPI001DA1BCCC|nr:TPM domain-containing protein [Rhodocyclaceae bacterium]MCP5220770.1 TPM domain-containing protein [Zoogloeaceae bacterium]HPR07346.1 TPM domain-containing protein [Denitromonas sp.]
MDLKRMLRHLMIPTWQVKRRFPESLLAQVESAIRASESAHRGEIGFAIEGGLDLPDLWRGVSPRQRALDAFATLGIWDTEENTGVLVYIQYADRAVEIVADRGITRHVAPEEWQAICRTLEACFRESDYAKGCAEAVTAIGDLIAAHFPKTDGNPNELPNRPVIL